MPASPKTTQGPADAVPCAHCGVDQDLTDLEVVERGYGIKCDNCGKTSEIIQVRKVTTVLLRQA